MKNTFTAVKRCHYALPWWAHERLVGIARRGLAEKIIQASVVNQTLTHDWESEGLALDVPADEAREPSQDLFFITLPMPLVAAVDKLGKAHGMSRKAVISFVLKWGAMHMPRTEADA